MKYLKRFLPVFLLFMTVFIGSKVDAKASALNENINVSVSMDSEVVFHPDGTPYRGMFIVWNDSNVGIEIVSVNITEYNGWQLVTSDTKIKTDAKQFSYQFDDRDMLGGRNEMHLEIKESESAILGVEINYGVWTYSSPFEKALEIEVEYEIEKQMRTLTLNGAGYASNSTLQVLETTEVTLPTLSNSKYQFMGWADSNGKRYTDTFTMPREDTTLTALWKLPTYAIYTFEDCTLTFVQSEKELKPGQKRNGKTISAVYTGFESQVYSSPNDVPWFHHGTWETIRSVVFEDPVFPKSTAYWFFQLYGCNRYDVSKLYTFQVQDMRYMFYLAGGNEEDSSVVIKGMENWDTSQVTSMREMFGQVGVNAKSIHIGNLGLWDVSSVQDMHNMFYMFGMHASEIYVGDLGMWKTNSLIIMTSMFKNMGSETTHLNIGNIGTWDMSKVVSLYGVFEGMGQYSETFYLGDISKWNVENVGNMDGTFANAGSMADWQLDLSSWNVTSVEEHSDFAYGVEDKIIEPIW